MFLRKVFSFGATFLLFNQTLVPAYAIYNGSASIQAPNVVQIIKENASGLREGGCSGALLASNVVVTAAHCVTDEETGLTAKKIWTSPPGAKWKELKEGDTTRLILEQTSSFAESRALYEKYRVTSVQLTSSYYSSGTIVGDNDVAFLVVEGELQLTTPITLASDEETEDFISNKKIVRIYGYGQTGFDLTATLAPQSTSMSFAFKHPSIANSALISSPSSSACPGDSGGPVIVSTPNRLYLVGIISGGANADSGPACSKLIEGNYYTLITLLTKYANLAFQSAILAAKESQVKAEAETKAAVVAAKESIIKFEIDAKAEIEKAKEAKNKAEEEAKALNQNLNKYEALSKQAAESIEALSTELSALKTKFDRLSSEASELKKKLTKICKSNKKVKGC